ncbi:MAG: NAD(P)-dependent alcohol dehydrogenase [Solirubrobacterales bacterium]
MPTSTAAVLREKGGGFHIEGVSVEIPRATEVLVGIAATGICHTDLLVRKGLMPPAPPAILGHEGSGVVESVGDAVTSVAPGDHVVLAPASCGRCPNCATGHPMHCRTFLGLNLRGRRADGTSAYRDSDGEVLAGHFFGQSAFSGMVVAEERSVVKVRQDAPLELLGPLGCGLQTGAGAVLNVLAPAPAASIAVFGAGAVGLAAVMAAHLVGCAEIIVIDRNARRLGVAADLGATRVIDVDGVADVTKEIIELTGGGVDYSVDAVGLPETVRNSVGVLNVGGATAIVGSAGTGQQVSLDIQHLFGRSLRGVVEGDSVPSVFIPRLVELVLSGRFPVDKLVTRYRFDEIDRAVEDLAEGTVIKPVLVR